MTEREVAARVSRRFDSYFLRGYVVGKLSLDPVYAAVLERVAPLDAPIVDIGCGIGLAAFYLREHGLSVPITGVDFDERKIGAARRAGQGYADLLFRAGDARDVASGGATVLLIDVLHYFSRADQARMLEDAAAVATTVIIRDALRDRSWRYRITAAAEVFARAVRWLKAERLNFLSREEIVGAFAGFDAEIVPMHGRTPFNNYLLVFRRESSGTTKA